MPHDKLVGREDIGGVASAAMTMAPAMARAVSLCQKQNKAAIPIIMMPTMISGDTFW